MLQHRAMCACEIKEALAIAQPTAFKHLKTLTEAGFIHWGKDGLWVNCHLSDGRKSPYAPFRLGSLRHWLEDDPEISQLIPRLPVFRREEICARPVSMAQAGAFLPCPPS